MGYEARIKDLVTENIVLKRKLLENKDDKNHITNDSSTSND